MTNDPAAITDALGSAGYRLTGPRRALADLISAQGGHFTAAGLEQAARQRRLRVGRATIFRALELLTQLGLVERLDLPTGEHAYVPCETGHHHHVVCSGCGRATDVDDLGLGDVFAEVAARTGYRIDRHRLELFGVCPRCQAEGGQ